MLNIQIKEKLLVIMVFEDLKFVLLDEIVKEYGLCLEMLMLEYILEVEKQVIVFMFLCVFGFIIFMDLCVQVNEEEEKKVVDLDFNSFLDD